MSVDSELSLSHSKANDDAKPSINPLVIAKYDIFSEKDKELNFKKGDLLYIIKTEGEWVYVRSKQSGQEGYISHNSVADLNSLDAKE